MVILGLSFGRKEGNSDILVKEALYAAKDEAANIGEKADIRFLNVTKKNIGRCRGCGACSTMLEKGKDNDCVFSDDFQEVEEEVRRADAIVLGVPVYVLQPTGQFKNFVDRFACRHDVSAINWVLDRRRSGEMPGEAGDFPMERLKKRTVAYISVGGASTENWTSMGTATLHLFGFSAMMKVVGNYNANSMGAIGNPYLDDTMMDDIHEIGRRLVSGLSDDSVCFYEPESKPAGVCPVCHQRLITILPHTTKVECPVCGIEGQLSVENDEIRVVFPPEQQARARGTFVGLREHTEEIQGFGAICGPKLSASQRMLEETMDRRIRHFEEEIEQ